MPNPIKRHISLQPVSREHHHGLLLSWKIREGVKRNVPAKRIAAYTNWFWVNHLEAHFYFEEKFMFPILGNENKLVQRALREHRRLKRLFAAKVQYDINLSLIEVELTAHIRFEERVLFQEIESMATSGQLNMIELAHSNNISDEWNDEFWTDF